LFKKIDQKLKELNYYEVGSTASIIYIIKIGYKKILYCINIGDTRCILTQKNCSRKISYDDLANDKYEINRINNGGGLIMNGRVSGKLMVTRSFGDWEQKSFGVISSPHITKIEINGEHKYVIMASDGVWDVLDDLEVYSLSLEAENSKELCNEIVNNSLEKGSKDNISCFVIKLND
jgi:serine/threonine protein phosphatase PrpC